MARRGWSPATWRALPRAERVEVLAFEHRRDEQRARLMRQMSVDMPTEIGVLAQVLIALEGE